MLKSGEHLQYPKLSKCWNPDIHQHFHRQKLKQRVISLLKVKLERLIYLLMAKLEIQTESEVLLLLFSISPQELKKKNKIKQFILCTRIYAFQKMKHFLFNFQYSIDSIIIFLDSTGYCITTPNIIFTASTFTACKFQHLLLWPHAIKRFN